MEDDRPGDARPREGGLGAIPRRVRSVLHAAAGGPEAAQGRLVRQPGAEGSALRRRPRRSPTRPNGTAAVAAMQAAPGRVEDGRAGPQVEIRGGVAALPRRHAIASSSDTSIAIRSTCRGRRRRAKRSSASSRRCSPRRRPRAPTRRPTNLVRRRFRTRGHAGSRRRSCRGRSSRTWRRAITRRWAASSPRGRRRSPAPISIPRPRGSGWRSWSRASRSSCTAQAEGAGATVADRAARAAVARAAGGEHDDRRPQRRGNEDSALARRRAGSPQRAGAVDAARSRARPRLPGR